MIKLALAIAFVAVFGLLFYAAAMAIYKAGREETTKTKEKDDK